MVSCFLLPAPTNLTNLTLTGTVKGRDVGKGRERENMVVVVWPVWPAFRFRSNGAGLDMNIKAIEEMEWKRLRKERGIQVSSCILRNSLRYLFPRPRWDVKRDRSPLGSPWSCGCTAIPSFHFFHVPSPVQTILATELG